MEDRFNEGKTVYMDAQGRVLTEEEYLKMINKPADEKDAPAEKEDMDND